MDNVVKDVAVQSLGESVPGAAGLVHLERDHDDGPLVASLGGLHHPGRQCPPQLVAVEAHERGRDLEAGLGLVRHTAASSVIIRVVLEADVANVKDGRYGGVDRHPLSAGHSDVAEVAVQTLEVLVVIQHGVLQGALLLVLLGESVR